MEIFSQWWFWVIVAVIVVAGGYIKLRVFKSLMASRSREQQLLDDQET
jgi:hypothetical protein